MACSHGLPTRKCRPCWSKYVRTWYANNPESYAKHKARVTEYNRRPEVQIKRRARARVHTALRNGTLTKPLVCSQCSGEGLRIEAHHTDYNKPLDIVWLCSTCHGLER